MLHHLLMQSAARAPRRPAVAVGEQFLTYEEPDRLSNQIARALLTRGVRAGDRVGILAPKSAACVVAAAGWNSGRWKPHCTSIRPSAKRVVPPMPDELLGNRLHAVITADDPRSLTREEVLNHCRRRLSAYIVLDVVEFCEALPRTSTGKVDRAELAEQVR